MRFKELWDLHRSFIIGFNVYLIFSLNFAGIFCHGRPPSISHQGYYARSQTHGAHPQRPSSQAWSPRQPYFAHRSSAGPSGENSSHNFNPSPIDKSDEVVETSSSNVPAVPATHKLVSRPHFLPPNVERTRGVSGGGPEVETDTIDLSKISHSRNSFRSPPTRALSPRKKPRLKISNRDRIENSIDRFDAFGDYEYIDTDVQQISAAIPGPGVLNNRRRAHLNQHRRVDFLPQNPPFHSPYIPANHRIRYQNHNFNRPPTNPIRNPYVTNFNNPPPPRLQFGPPRRKDPNTVPYHDPAASNQKLPVSHFLPPTTPAPSLISTFLGLAGLTDGPSSPPGAGGGIADTIFGFFGGDDNSVDQQPHHDPYHTPYYPVGYHDYEYGDYDEGVGLYPPKKLTVSERVWKWFNGFRMPSARKTPKRRPLPGEKQSRPVQPLDYSDYETGDDQNLIFYNNQNGGRPVVAGGSSPNKYDFQDVLYSIRNNETGVEIAKKFLSAAASLTDRSDTNPVFMMWTIPTTIFALFGVVYLIGAIGIVGYKYFLAANDLGQAVNLIPVVIALSIPIVIGFIVVTTRASVRGEINVNQLMRGDVQASMRQDFDGVDFTMDALFGSASLLGVAWLVSVAL